MLTLALETSGSPGSAALGDAAAGGAAVWRTEFPTGPRHGGGLFSAIEAALAFTRQTNSTIDEIRVGLGPGSYAGVRAALAAAAGLALALRASAPPNPQSAAERSETARVRGAIRNPQLIGLPSVCAYLTDASSWHAVGDARRGAWYHTAVENGHCVEGPEVATMEQLLARLAARPDWLVLAAEEIPALPAARCTRADAARLLALPLDPTPRPLEPIYLRDPYITQPRPRPL